MKKGSVIYWDFSQTSHSNQSIQKGAELYQDEIDTLPRAVLITLWMGGSVLRMPLSMSLLWELTSMSINAAVLHGVDASRK
ncbi:hypothetical protein HZ326_8848 [Fusarium oxysporum f. sp. albedinis]|nr:hypothetical protein HZ326_8848 [Fusarium oxysporum f. sp. albedinis]